MISHDERKNFTNLCLELGERINSAENAMLCHRAYLAYLDEYPDTARGKGNKSDRDPTCMAFRNKAAEISGVAAATIDALLQVGKALAPLSDDLKTALPSSSLSMRTLRKLATKRFDATREDLIRTFLEDKIDDSDLARTKLEAAVAPQEEGLAPRGSKEPTDLKRGKQPSMSFEGTYEVKSGEPFEMRFGKYAVRVTIDSQPDGRMHVRTTNCHHQHGATKEIDGGADEGDEKESAPSLGELANEAA